MAEYFTGTGELVPDNRPRENPSMREISNTEEYFNENPDQGDVYMMRVQTTVYKDEPKERRGSWVHLLISCPSNSLATLTFRQSQCHVYPLYLTEELNGFHCIFKNNLEKKIGRRGKFWVPFKVIAGPPIPSHSGIFFRLKKSESFFRTQGVPWV